MPVIMTTGMLFVPISYNCWAISLSFRQLDKPGGTHAKVLPENLQKSPNRSIRRSVACPRLAIISITVMGIVPP